MALPAGRFEITRRQNRLFPCQGAAVSSLHRGRRALPAMTHRASEVAERVWNRRMRPVGLNSHIGQRRFLHCDVTGGAAVGYIELRKPDLLQARLETALQGCGVTALADQLLVSPLIPSPLAKVILRGHHCQAE